MTTYDAMDLQQRLARLPVFAAATDAMTSQLGAAQPASWPRLWTGVSQLGAAQPASWPRVWSTEGQFDVMSRLNQLPFHMQQGLGGANSQFGGVMEDLQTLVQKAPGYVTQLVTIVNKAAPYLPTIVNIVEDPALPQVIAHVQKLKAIDAAKSAPPGVPASAAPSKPGVGLARTLPLWDAVLGYVKYPWAPWAIAGGVVLVIGGLGFGIGRWTKRCKTGAIGRRYRRRR